jgi:N-acetylglucosaminyl-diphospho-decaprenol L-rhamnosyltransferase
VKTTVVIPTLDASALLCDALASLGRQTTAPHEIVVVDNASTDGTSELVRERFPRVRVVRNERNLGFGRAVNAGVAAADPSAEAIVLVNNDATCEPTFVERLVEPLADPTVGMVAGVLLQGSAPALVDTAGIELDTTIRSWDIAWNTPVADLGAAPAPVGPCGGAAAYRASVFRELGGFDESLFAYWEDVELALRIRNAGWGCVRADGARALHLHSATLGASSPAQRRLEAFGRAYVLAKYRVARRSPLTRLKVAALDWPVLLVHLVARRELGPLKARWAGTRAGLTRPAERAPFELATVGFRAALGRQANVLRLRFGGGLPDHF